MPTAVIDAFEAAVDAVVSGDEAGLKALLADDPGLVHVRSQRPHHATLLTYIAANGVEDERQTTPANAVAIVRLLLEAGADPNATARCYGGEWSVLGLLVSSVHPHKAGLQALLAVALLDHGAEMTGALLTTLAHGCGDTAKVLADYGTTFGLAEAAGMGWMDHVRSLLPSATPDERHRGMAVAAIHGCAEAVRLLLDAGEDPNRFNPDGFHAHSTPLHQAVWAGHLDTVRVLVEHGARRDIADTAHGGTAVDWAEHAGQTAIADYLRQLAP